MQDQAVTRFAVTAALRGVEREIARAPTNDEREALAAKHAELRGLLPAQVPEPQPQAAAEEVRGTPREHLRREVDRLVAEYHSARHERTRRVVGNDIMATERKLARLCDPSRREGADMIGDRPVVVKPT